VSVYNECEKRLVYLESLRVNLLHVDQIPFKKVLIIILGGDPNPKYGYPRGNK